MLKKLIKKVMFHSKLKNQNKELLNIPKDQISLSLSKDEIAILLQSIKNSNFSGSVLEDLYNLVYKLQTNYNKLK
jgi:hypothetical protein|tara:strand:+ start:128 stop:352 length:225 start_codon:yes stop_codon:yes gene_type:complete